MPFKVGVFVVVNRSAYYDVGQDRIVGCRRGSLEWWHERGHQLLRKKYRWFRWLELFQELALPAALALSFWLSGFGLLQAFGFFMFALSCFDETYAYCFQQRVKDSMLREGQKR